LGCHTPRGQWQIDDLPPGEEREELRSGRVPEQKEEEKKKRKFVTSRNSATDAFPICA
jgi:hypothetical protein